MNTHKAEVGTSKTSKNEPDGAVISVAIQKVNILYALYYVITV